jgi:aminopeptidase-like protein
MFAQQACTTTRRVDLRQVAELAIHGQEPPADVAAAMRDADLILGMTRMSMAHTQARLAASNDGARYLSMPDYDLALLQNPAVMIDYHAAAARVRGNTVAGFVVNCIGDDRVYSYLASRTADTLSDRVGKHALANIDPDFLSYSFLKRGSDERQYCSPGVDLPVVAVMRSKFGEYPEYHTSLDDLSLISPAGLRGGYQAMTQCLDILDRNFVYEATTPCEPQLGKRGLFPTLGTRDNNTLGRDTLNVLAYADGAHDLLAIAEQIGIPAQRCADIAEELASHDLPRRVETNTAAAPESAIALVAAQR